MSNEPEKKQEVEIEDLPADPQEMTTEEAENAKGGGVSGLRATQFSPDLSGATSTDDDRPTLRTEQGG